LGLEQTAVKRTGYPSYVGDVREINAEYKEDFERPRHEWKDNIKIADNLNKIVNNY
jgi:hypothetical protein